MRADWYLFAHGVDPVGPQQRHCLLHQVGPSTVQHPEAQVLLELGFSGHCVQLPRSAKAVVCPEGARDGHMGAAAFPRVWSLRADLPASPKFPLCFSCLLVSLNPLSSLQLGPSSVPAAFSAKNRYANVYGVFVKVRSSAKHLR